VSLKDDARRTPTCRQFGVGFLSAFMVADNIVVTSRKAGTDST
jgi:HSP90 family molecular chaperone